NARQKRQGPRLLLRQHGRAETAWRVASGSKLTTMLSSHISRFRAAIILAVAVFVWSDAALASFVCPHMSGCEHGMPAQTHQRSSDAQAAEPMPCCPMNSEISMECAASVMECCAWHRGESDQSAILFASDNPRTKQIAAVLPATTPATP